MAQYIGYTKEPLVFKVTRQPPELITPAKPTPYEFKELSDIDSQDCLRFKVPLTVFYRNNPAMKGKNPAEVVKDALAKSLVPYYPMAGRLREKEGGKLVVECNGKGIIFTEADADVSLEEFGDPIHPPIPCLDQLLFDVPGTSDILDIPLILMQVTRLKCGGFILALRMSHPMVDAQGMAQFLMAVAEISNNASTPSIQPMWERHLLSARNPPRVTCEHHAYDDLPDIKSPVLQSNHMIQHKSFYFGTKEITALKRLIPSHLKCSTFEVISAGLWRCYTIALQLDPEEVVRLLFVVDARTVFNPLLPPGYYGNVISFQVARSTAAELGSSPIGYALELVKKAKSEVTQEYMMSLADLMVRKRPQLDIDFRTFGLSDTTRAQSIDPDFGWGSPAYVGIGKSAIAEGEVMEIRGGNIISFKNKKGEIGIVISLRLPANVMDVFAQELNVLLRDASELPTQPRSSNRISSSL